MPRATTAHPPLRTSRLRAVLALALACAACGSTGGTTDAGLDGALDATTDTTRDAPGDGAASTTDAADAGCSHFEGAFSLSSTCIPLSGQLFPTMCVTQVGCEVTLSGGGMTLRGTAHGAMVALASPAAPNESCTLVATTSGVSLRCTDARAGTVCSGTATAISVAGASRFCCDNVAQDCGDGARCTLVLAGDNGLIAACLPPSGSVTAGGACTRAMGMVGFDPCAAGLFCANTGEPSRDMRVCRPFCASAAQCGPGEVCYNLSGVAPVGLCTPGCALGGTDCPAGMTCRYSPALDATGAATFAGICDPLGTTAHNGTCSDSANCMAGETCGNSRTGPRCLTICDAHTPCPTGQTCSAFLPAGTPNPPGQGTCQ